MNISKAILEMYGNNKKGILQCYSELRKLNKSDVQIIKMLLKNAGCKNLVRKSSWALGQISANLIKLCYEK